MKIGISVRIDVTKIDKARLYKGEKGTYLDLTTFIDTEEKKYDNNGFISQSVTKEEREAGVKTPILGNCKVIFKGETTEQRTVQYAKGVSQAKQAMEPDPFEDTDIPF